MKKEKDREVFFIRVLFRNCNFLVVVVYVCLISVSRARIKVDVILLFLISTTLME